MSTLAITVHKKRTINGISYWKVACSKKTRRYAIAECPTSTLAATQYVNDILKQKKDFKMCKGTVEDSKGNWSHDVFIPVM
jgi:hypothetical protein